MGTSPVILERSVFLFPGGVVLLNERIPEKKKKRSVVTEISSEQQLDDLMQEG
jgi:hypothetical protein